MKLAWALASAELLKLKRTSTLWICAISPLIFLLPVLFDIVDQRMEGRVFSHRAVALEWRLAVGEPLAMWAIVSPLAVALTAAGLSNPEHAGKHWKQLYAMPVPRWSIFAAKTAICGLLTGGSYLIFAVGVFALALLRSGIFGLDLTSAIPWSEMAQWVGAAFLATAAAIAIHAWMSMRFAGIVIPLAVAAAAVLLGGFLAHLKLSGWWPWSMPLDTLRNDGAHSRTVIASIALFAIVGAFAAWRLSREEILP